MSNNDQVGMRPALSKDSAPGPNVANNLPRALAHRPKLNCSLDIICKNAILNQHAIASRKLKFLSLNLYNMV